jgi:hypothetical protein
VSGILGATPDYESAPRPPVAKPATIGEAFDAQRILARGDRMDAEAERLRRGYEPVLAEINADRAARGLKPLVNPGHWVGDVERRPSAEAGSFDFGGMFEQRIDRRQQQAAIFAELRAIRKRNPAFLTGVPDDDRIFHRGLLDADINDRARARGTIARTEGVAANAAGFAGGVFETMHDPVNLFSLPIGGGGRTIVSQVARSALINGALEAIQQPQVLLNREDLGEELTFGEAAMNTGFAAAGGAVFEVAVPQALKAGAKAADAAYERLRPGGHVARALARAELPDDALASRFAGLVPEHARSFDERAALAVIGREAEVRGSSPYVPTPEGMDAHARRMQAEIDALLAATPGAGSGARGTPAAPANVPQGTRRPVVRAGGIASDVVGFFRAKGYSEAQARGIAAGIHAESASNHGAVNPSSGALGLGQWLGPRKAGLIRRYGPRPTREQQLEYLHWELQGGDHGGRAVLAGADEAGVLDAYIRAFMRPAAGAETTGDLARGMAALGREGEEIVARALDEGEGAPIVRPAALDAERGAIDAPELVEIGEPALAREIFTSDDAWRRVQVRADAQALGLPADEVQRVVWRDALDELLERQAGEVPAALHHPELGPIDMKWGEAGDAARDFRGGYGLSHIIAKHPELPLEELQGLIRGMDVARVRSERIDLESPDHRAAVALTWHGEDQQWLVTAFRMGEPPDGPTSMRGPQDGGTGSSRPGGAPVVRGSGPEGNAVARAPDVTPEIRDAIDAAAPETTKPRQLDLFDDPGGEGASLQADSLMHDLRAQVAAIADETQPGVSDRAYRLEDGSEKSAAEILADLDEDAALVAALRGCL